MMHARKEALVALREYLECLSSEARVRLRPTGKQWSHVWPWPGPGAARRILLEQIARALRAMENGGEVEVKPSDHNGSSVAMFRWPAMPGLYPDHAADAVLGKPDEVALADERSSASAGVSGSVPDVEPPVKPPKASRVCAAHVLAALYTEQRRMTGSQLVSRFYNTPLEFSASSLEATCSWLVQTGKLDNARDERGKGYGLPDWDSEPDRGAILGEEE